MRPWRSVLLVHCMANNVNDLLLPPSLLVNPWTKTTKSNIDPSIEQVAAIAQQSHSLPTPTLDLSLLAASAPESQLNGYSHQYPAPPPPMSSLSSPPVPAYAENDPWNSNFRGSTFSPGSTTAAGVSSTNDGNGSSIMGGLPPNWWAKQEKVVISIFPEKQGFILNRYTVYVLQPDVSGVVQLNALR